MKVVDLAISRSYPCRKSKYPTNVKFFLSTTLLLIALSGQSQNSSVDHYFPIETSHSYIEFTVKYMGYAKVKGRFSEFDGVVYYDEDMAKMSANLRIPIAGIDTDLEFRDNDLQSENWFDAKQFPIAQFSSTRSIATSSGSDVIGNLTIRGVTRETTIHMDPPSGILRDIRGDLQVILTGKAKINRLDFGIEGKKWSAIKEGITAVESDVELEFSLLGKRIQKENFKNWVSNVQFPAGKLYQIFTQSGAAACVSEFERMNQAGQVKESALSSVAYMLRLEGKSKEAIVLLEANKTAFPEVIRTYEDLAIAYLAHGDVSKAKEAFDIALQKDPTSPVAREFRRHL